MNRTGELAFSPEQTKKLVPHEKPQPTTGTEAVKIKEKKSKNGRVVYPREQEIKDDIRQIVISKMLRDLHEEPETSIMSRTIFGKELENLTPEEIAIFNIDYNFPSTKKMMDVLATKKFKGKTYDILTPQEKAELLREFYEHPNRLTNNFLSAELYGKAFDNLSEDEQKKVSTRTERLAALAGLNKVDVARNHISLSISDKPITTDDDYISAGERFPMGVIEKDDIMSFVLFGVPMAETTEHERAFIKSKVVGNLETRLGIFETKEGIIDTESVENLAKLTADAHNTFCDLYNLPQIETYPLEGIKKEGQDTVDDINSNVSLGLFPTSLKRFINTRENPYQSSQRPKDYLNQHLNPPKWVEKLSIEKSDQEFFETVLDYVDYTQPEGHAVVGDENLGAEVSFTSIPEEQVAHLKKLYPDNKTLRRFKILTQLEFRGKGGSIIRLDDILPPGTTVYFEPLGYYRETNSEASIVNKNVFLNEDPVSIKGLAILLHEIGHIADTHNIQGEENPRLEALVGSNLKLNHALELSHKDASVVMRGERNAWAFALKHMRKLFEPDSLIKKGLFGLIHNKCLSSYSRDIQTRLR